MSTQPFQRKESQLFCEDIELSRIANEYDTPTYIYSRNAIEEAWSDYEQALTDVPHLVCYAVKANSNLAILSTLARLGSGFDIVSGGELERVLLARGRPENIVFSGVGKTRAEMERALEVGIRCFNVESLAELQLLNQIAKNMGVIAPIALRINPDVDAQTHPYIATGLKENKFGIDPITALRMYQEANAMTHIEIKGLGFHIGSQLTQITPFIDALKRALHLIEVLKQEHHITIQHLDIGGGLGICYQDEHPPEIKEFINEIRKTLGNRELELIIEPGRSIIGNAGVLLTRVLYIKANYGKNFAIVDAAMNDLLRPALYSAWQDIIPVTLRQHGKMKTYDIVGPICETADFLGKERALNIVPGDLLAVMSSGAYGFSMSSNYNSRGRPAEVMIDKDEIYTIREREDINKLIDGEYSIPN